MLPKNIHQKKATIISVLLLSMSVSCIANDVINTVTKFPQYISYNASSIAKVKQSLLLNKANNHTQKAYAHLLTKANKALAMANPTVMDKHFTPPSNTKHDYLSLSRYWWPDPETKNGLPWIRRDGITNPDTQTDNVDRKRLGRTMKSIKVLSLAYYFSEEEKYAQKAISLIHTWFLDDKTKMNPHLEYAQSIPGHHKPRQSGILDGRIIPENILDAMTILSDSPSWTTNIDHQMKAWLKDYFTWLTTSNLGQAGAKQTNNHGSWYRFQVAALAQYLQDDERLTKAISDAKNSLAVQFNSTGAQTHELARTRGFFYSCFNLQALARVAIIAEQSNLSLWHYKSAQGHSLQLAIDYLIPVAYGEKWPHNSKNIELSQLAMVLGELVPYSNDPKYGITLRKILKDISKKQKLSNHEQYVYNHFALLQPELM